MIRSLVREFSLVYFKMEIRVLGPRFGSDKKTDIIFEISYKKSQFRYVAQFFQKSQPGSPLEEEKFKFAAHIGVG